MTFPQPDPVTDTVAVPVQHPFICAAILPMTLDRVGRDCPSLDEEPLRVGSVEDAFQIFKPRVDISVPSTGRNPHNGEQREFQISIEFESLDDFDLESMQRRRPDPFGGHVPATMPNALADLSERSESLHWLEAFWARPFVREAWTDPPTRAAFVTAISQVRHSLLEISRASKSTQCFKELPRPSFRPEAAIVSLAGMNEPPSENDNHEAITRRIEAEVHECDETRCRLLRLVFEQVEPVERNFRSISLFFENCREPDGTTLRPVELYVLNADANIPEAALYHNSIFCGSRSLAVLNAFVAQRNDNFSFADDVGALIIPSLAETGSRILFEKLAASWGLPLITELGDVRSFEYLRNNITVGGRFEFVRFPEDNGSLSVIAVGYLRLREAHWFELTPGDGLYGAGSMALAGVLARAEYGAKVGDEWVYPIEGSDKSQLELGAADLDSYRIERQIVTTIRDSDNRLCFCACRPAVDDPSGVLRNLSKQRFLRYIDRYIRFCLRVLAGQILTRDLVIEEFEKPVRKLLDEHIRQGYLRFYDLHVDKSFAMRRQGICSVELQVWSIWGEIALNWHGAKARPFDVTFP